MSDFKAQILPVIAWFLSTLPIAAFAALIAQGFGFTGGWDARGRRDARDRGEP